MSNNVGDFFSIEEIVKSIVRYSKNSQVMNVLNDVGYDIIRMKEEKDIKNMNPSISSNTDVYQDINKIIDIKKRWEDILIELKKISFKQYEYLKNTEVVYICNDFIYLNLPSIYSSYKDRMQNNSLNFEKAIKNISKYDFKIIYLCSDGEVSVDNLSSV